ncbi:MAG: hypothetical protein WCA44_17915 [Acidobacteriaceae bacterium]
MLTNGKKGDPVTAVLRNDMVIDRKRREKGDVVELSYREYLYLAGNDRVLEATKENIDAVKAEAKAEKEAAARSRGPSEADTLRAKVKELEERLAAKGK